MLLSIHHLKYSLYEKEYQFINHRLLSLVLSHGYAYPTPSNLNYFWGFGSLLGVFMVFQVISGLLLSIHYTNVAEIANFSVEYILRDIDFGWFLKFFHSTTASLLFFMIYVHIGKGLYYRSFRKHMVWRSGLILYFLLMGVSFLGYTLPYGQMSLWGATVITNLVGVIFPPTYIDFAIFAWGGRSVGSPTLKRFYTLHFLLPVLLLSFMLLHLYVLHLKGSSNPLGIINRLDEVKFYPKYIVKDFFGFSLITSFFILYLVFYNPFYISDPDNYIEANPLSTPKHITPEWYFLPFYGMLRSIPNKVTGVCVMFCAILVLFFLPLIPFRCKSSSFCILSQFFFWCFTLNFICLGWLAAHPVIFPYTILSGFTTFFYFFYLLFILPMLSFLEFITIYNKINKTKILVSPSSTVTKSIQNVFDKKEKKIS